MPPHLIVIEGPDGVGKSAHAARLVASLRERGVNAVLYQHPKPPEGAGRVEAAMHFALARAVMLRTEKAPVVVADRWLVSNMVALGGAANQRELAAMRSIVQTETAVTAPPRAIVLLTASRKVLDARLRARGAEPSPREVQDREVYLLMAREARKALAAHAPRRDTVIDTARPQDEVAAEILTFALRALEGVAR